MVSLQFDTIFKKPSFSTQLAQLCDDLDEFHALQSLLCETCTALCEKEEDLGEPLQQGLRLYSWWLRQWSEHLKNELHGLHDRAKASELSVLSESTELPKPQRMKARPSSEG